MRHGGIREPISKKSALGKRSYQAEPEPNEFTLFKSSPCPFDQTIKQPRTAGRGSLPFQAAHVHPRQVPPSTAPRAVSRFALRAGSRHSWEAKGGPANPAAVLAELFVKAAGGIVRLRRH